MNWLKSRSSFSLLKNERAITTFKLTRPQEIHIIHQVLSFDNVSRLLIDWKVAPLAIQSNVAAIPSMKFNIREGYIKPLRNLFIDSVSPTNLPPKISDPGSRSIGWSKKIINVAMKIAISKKTISNGFMIWRISSGKMKRSGNQIFLATVWRSQGKSAWHRGRGLERLFHVQTEQSQLTSEFFVLPGY